VSLFPPSARKAQGTAECASLKRCYQVIVSQSIARFIREDEARSRISETGDGFCSQNGFLTERQRIPLRAIPRLSTGSRPAKLRNLLFRLFCLAAYQY
jgi:hypothetical protein